MSKATNIAKWGRAMGENKWIRWSEGESPQRWTSGERAWVLMGRAVDIAWWHATRNEFVNAFGRKMQGVTYYMRYYAPDPPEPAPVYECPYCGNPEVYACHDNYFSAVFYAKCFLCRAQGPTGKRADVLAHWKRKGE